MHVHRVEELYETPQNILNISVRNPITCNERDTGKPFVEYEVATEVGSFSALLNIHLKTNIPLFNKQVSCVRRRYRDFARLREIICVENPHVRVPALPPKRVLSNKLSEEIIVERQSGLGTFLKLYPQLFC